MSIKIIKRIVTKDLLNFIPQRYKEEMQRVPIENKYVDLILSNLDKNDVITSRQADKIANKITPAEHTQVIILGGCFTVEALHTLKQKKIITVALSDFYWTDARYEYIKVSISKKNKSIS
jgi:hypothetical protein